MISVDLDHQSIELGDMRVKLDVILEEVVRGISPVWPLKDYVAVNPYFGMADRTFMSARTFLRVFSDCEMLMPIPYYASQWRAGKFDALNIQQALTEIVWPQNVPPVTADQMVQLLTQATPSEEASAIPTPNRSRPIRCLVEHAAAVSAVNWREIVIDEVSKFCAAHYDDDQASWGSEWKQESLYAAWHAIAQVDRNAELLGLSNMRKLVASLPAEPRTAIVDLLCRLNVPYPLWSTVLMSQVFSMPGWFAWTRYQDDQPASKTHDEFIGLLAVRLAYDVAVSETLGLQIDWKSYIRNGYASFQGEEPQQVQQAWVRYTLLRACEIGYRNQLLSKLPSLPLHPAQPVAKEKATTAQMVFCIDVRSERMRRHIEKLSPSIETFGFAGFFGLPIEFQALGESQATAQLPVLLKPQYCVHEHLSCASAQQQEQVVSRRTDKRWWRKLWQGFKSSSIGSFGFVESSGLLAGIQLVRQALGQARPTQHQRDGLDGQANQLRPNVCGHSGESMSQAEQIETAYRVLKNLGLTKDFARLVVLCGHFSQTSNNPLAASLDCGACGGHSGAPNARWLALVLNQTDVRLGLYELGIAIPSETHFLAAAHNTTVDEIEFYDVSELPSSHRRDFDELQATCRDAAAAVALERASQLDAQGLKDVLRRAVDWSEVRPEWGLAGNVAFVVGPRALTSGLDLNGQVFLHSYEATQDTEGTILETIMTAPMIVANWINMQYYASTVDNAHFGSGSKAIHNVVGKFGVLSGNSGDLKTGLPLQSIHDGTTYRHVPLRLLVVIRAPRASIERIYQKHELVANLVNNEWLSVVAVEGQEHYKLGLNGSWKMLKTA